LAQRLVWMQVYLETVERAAIEDGVFEPGQWCQMVNTMIGLARTLGLERQARPVEDLDEYLKRKRVRTA